MGGPPCQGFSLSNTRTRNMKNKKNFLFLEFVRLVQKLRPEWFVLENAWGKKLSIRHNTNGNSILITRII